MPYIPDFSSYKARNKWIKEHADYFTAIRRWKSSYIREEKQTYEEVIAFAQKAIKRMGDVRFLIYAVYQGHDALVATVSSQGVTEHE